MPSVTKEFWLVGKGPSLDGYNFDDVNGDIIAINETAFLVPCKYAIAIDFPVLDKFVDLPNHIMIWRKSTINRKFPNEYLWEKGRNVTKIRGTAMVALQVAHHLGGRFAHLVGFDGLLGNYDCSEDIQQLGAVGRDYAARAEETWEVLRDLRLDFDVTLTTGTYTRQECIRRGVCAAYKPERK